MNQKPIRNPWPVRVTGRILQLLTRYWAPRASTVALRKTAQALTIQANARDGMDGDARKLEASNYLWKNLQAHARADLVAQLRSKGFDVGIEDLTTPQDEPDKAPPLFVATSNGELEILLSTEGGRLYVLDNRELGEAGHTSLDALLEDFLADGLDAISEEGDEARDELIAALEHWDAALQAGARKARGAAWQLLEDAATEAGCAQSGADPCDYITTFRNKQGKHQAMLWRYHPTPSGCDRWLPKFTLNAGYDSHDEATAALSKMFPGVAVCNADGHLLCEINRGVAGHVD